jgi:phosphopantothenoylcysteine decarboxylase
MLELRKGAETSADEVAVAYNDGKIHLLLAASGSVATIKLPLIVKALEHHANLSIRIVLTSSAAQFFNGEADEQPSLSALSKLPKVDAVYMDEDEQAESWVRGAGILHINLRKWAHMLVIAPLSANSLAKITNGICDSLLTNLVRAWDTSGLVDGGKKKRILVFPAMNAAMWLQPITAKQIRILEEDWGVHEGAEEKSEGWFEVFRPIEVRETALIHTLLLLTLTQCSPLIIFIEITGLRGRRCWWHARMGGGRDHYPIKARPQLK